MKTGNFYWATVTTNARATWHMSKGNDETLCGLYPESFRYLSAAKYSEYFASAHVCRKCMRISANLEAEAK
jgi:hypothetical protein